MLVTPLPKPTRAKKRKLPKPVSKERVREIVKERDGDWCILCGRPGKGLHLHRVEYGPGNPGYVPSNCILACHEHHVPVIHASKAIWQPLLMDYLNREGEARREAYIALQRRFREWVREKHPTG